VARANTFKISNYINKFSSISKWICYKYPRWRKSRWQGFHHRLSIFQQDIKKRCSWDH